jgi:hypothetical protein
MTERPGIDFADPWAAIEACYARGWTDDLPVVTPTEPLVDTMLATGRTQELHSGLLAAGIPP